MKVPTSATSVSPLVRWSTNHRLTAFSCAIVLLSGWVISQPDRHEDGEQDRERDEQQEDGPAERPAGRRGEAAGRGHGTDCSPPARPTTI